MHSVPYEISEVQQQHRLHSHKPCWTCNKGKVMTFFDESLLCTKPGLAHRKQTWNVNQMNGSIPGNTVPRCISKTDGKRSVLLHVPAAPTSFSVQKNATTLGGTELHHSPLQCKESHCCCCHGSLVPRAMGDSRTATVVIRYESMRLRSLRQSERTTVRSRYNTIDELIRGIGKPIRNINKDGCADAIRRLPKIWQKVDK